MSGRFTKPPSWPRPSSGSKPATSKPAGSKPAGSKPAPGPDPRWPADWQLGVPRPEPRWPSSSLTVPAGFPRVPAVRPAPPVDTAPARRSPAAPARPALAPPGVAAGAPLAAATPAPGRPVTPASPPSLTTTLLEIGSPAPAPTRAARPTPARMFGWGSLGLVLLVVAGFTVDGLATPPPPLVDSTQAETPATDPIHQAIERAAAGTALAEVGRLKIRRHQDGGFTWSQFGSAPADTDGNGCYQHTDVLRRDLTELTLQPGTHGCAVATGVLHDPYTGRTISYRRSASSGV